VLGTVLSDVVKLVIPGVFGGLFLAILVVRLIVPWRGLAGAVMEPLIFALGVALAVGVAFVAALPAARRALSVEPMVAMRSE
jgi:ABC-type antimicrobial peptide transport system permease subunit